jgi:hypothetical protein
MSLCKSLAEPAASLTARRTRQIDEGEEHGADLLPGRGPILRNALATPTIAGFLSPSGSEDLSGIGRSEYRKTCVVDAVSGTRIESIPRLPHARFGAKPLAYEIPGGFLAWETVPGTGRR